MTYNYRIIYHADAPDGPWYGLHRVHYKDGVVFSWSEQPVSFTSKAEEGEDAIAAELELAVAAYQRPTLTLTRKDWKIS